MRIFFSVGEPSGDVHGANLIREFKRRQSDIECVGYGGPQMAAAGCQLHADLTALAVMWFVRVLLNLHKFWGLASRADRYFRHRRPDAVVLIDYPGFNWWIARRAKVHGIPVFYYGAPQMWAWAPWRVRKMRRLVDHVLCKLPFEPAWYRQRGCHATYVGHPFFDEVRRRLPDREFMDRYGAAPGRLVTILPGSRTQEVTNNLRWLLSAVRQIGEAVPDTRFAVAAFKESQARTIREEVRRAGLPIDVFVGRTADLIRLAYCCVAVSGSVSLELLYHEKPTVVLYWMNRFALETVRRLRLIRVKFMTLVNLLAADEPFDRNPQRFDPAAPGAEKVPFPEYPTCEDKSKQIAAHVVEWLTDEREYARRVTMLRELKAKYAHPGATSRAAEYILSQLSARRVPVPRPHFLPIAQAVEEQVC